MGYGDVGDATFGNLPGPRAARHGAPTQSLDFGHLISRPRLREQEHFNDRRDLGTSSAFELDARAVTRKTRDPPGRVVTAPFARKLVGGWCEQDVKQHAMGYGDVGDAT